MNLWGMALHLFGWKVDITAPRHNKCVICVAPHTSNFDFILGLLAYKSMGRKANFLMKESWFFFPLNYIFKAFGGIPVARGRKTDLTSRIIRRFDESDYVNLAVTPEGTRSNTSHWHTGFIYMAKGANVPIQLGVIDYRSKTIIIKEEFLPSGNISDDMEFIRAYYSGFADVARKPENFSLPDIPVKQ